VPGHERAPTVLAFWDDLSLRLPRSALASAWEEGIVLQSREAVLGLALDATARRGLAASFDGRLAVFDPAERVVLATLDGHDGAATSVALGGGKAVSGGRDWTVRVWDTQKGRGLAVLDGHAETVTSVDVSPGGARAASASVDGTVRLWDLDALAPGPVLKDHAAHVSCVRFSADGLVLASAGWDGSARLWDAETGAPLGALEGHAANVTALAIHPAGRQVATGDEQGLVRVFDPRMRREVRRFAGRGAAVTALSFTADGRFLLVASRDASVRVLDLRRGDEARALPHPAPVLALALSASGTRLLTAGADGGVRAWRLDWELDPGGAAATPTAMLAPEALRARTTLAPTRAVTLRDDLRRAAPPPSRAIPRAVGGAARSVPWRRIATAAVVVLALAGSLLLWRKPKPRLRLSPYFARTIPTEIDLIRLDRLTPFCRPEDYGAHLGRLVSGHPEAKDVACVAAAGQPSVVADVLDGAPLEDADPMAARRLRRNAASALAELKGTAAESVCARLSDPRDAVRAVAEVALGVNGDASAVSCVRDAVENGGGAGQASAARAFRQQLARGFVPVASGWATVQSLLRSPDPAARREGLRLVPLFSSAFARPAAEALFQDPDADVAKAARAAVAEVDGMKRTDLMMGDIEP
jgi:WD40 repeat protein